MDLFVIKVVVEDQYGDVVFDFDQTEVVEDDLLVNGTYNIPKIIKSLNETYGTLE